MSGFGRDTLRHANVEIVAFNLEQDWETSRIVQEKKDCLKIESIELVDINHEVGCSLMMEFDCRQSCYSTSCLKCTSSGHSHEIGLFEYFPFEKEKGGYELNCFQHMDDEASEAYKIIKHLEEVIA